ncbi:hypothetical protein D3C80_1960950 [compost metagenome]
MSNIAGEGELLLLISIAYAGLFAGKPAPPETAQSFRTVHFPVGAGEPAKRPAQVKAIDQCHTAISACISASLISPWG